MAKNTDAKYLEQNRDRQRRYREKRALAAQHGVEAPVMTASVASPIPAAGWAQIADALTLFAATIRKVGPPLEDGTPGTLTGLLARFIADSAAAVLAKPPPDQLFFADFRFQDIMDMWDHASYSLKSISKRLHDIDPVTANRFDRIVGDSPVPTAGSGA
jgi:hypothetical protein